MLKIIFCLLACSSIFAVAPDVLEGDLHWELFEVDEAIEAYSAAISRLEKAGSLCYQEQQDRFLALWKRSFIYAFLGNHEKALQDLALIQTQDPHFVILEPFLRDLQNGEALETVLEEMGENVTIYFDQYYGCCSDCEKKAGCQFVKRERADSQDVADCKKRCEYVASLAYQAVDYLPIPFCWVGSGLVWGVNKGCLRCCKNGGLIATCVTPFAKVLKYPVDRVRQMIQERFIEKSNSSL
jgi:hypothetical protein